MLKCVEVPSERKRAYLAQETRQAQVQRREAQKVPSEPRVPREDEIYVSETALPLYQHRIWSASQPTNPWATLQGVQG